jgi:predicted RND superfamily exporter protein
MYTTVAIAGGFAVLGLSEFTVTRNLGFVTAGTVSLCLLADLTLLPVLLVSVVAKLPRVRSAEG